MAGEHGGYSGNAQDAVRAALERGNIRGFGFCAIYLPGEDVRCPGLPTESRRCGGFLFTEGPESVAQVRVYEARRFNERRRTPRGNYRCPRHDHHRLEVESHMISVSSVSVTV